VIAIILVVIWNFFTRRFIVFKKIMPKPWYFMIWKTKWFLNLSYRISSIIISYSWK
jgi:hypothetical protein